MQTALKRIDLAESADLEEDIQNLCIIMSAAGFSLKSTFVHELQLVLIFQK